MEKKRIEDLFDVKTMNLFALNGHKVKCYTLSGGYEHDQEIACKYLEIGKEYTIDRTDVEDWSTSVFLKEFPNVIFNSVLFQDSKEQSENDSKKHKDYNRYN